MAQDQDATNRTDATRATSHEETLEPGFYWVLPIFDVDSDEDAWHQKEQPAYWDGATWFMLGVENESWQPICVGERIMPVTPVRQPTLTK